MIQDGVYGIKYRCSTEMLEQPHAFEAVKGRLSEEFFKNIILPTIGDKKYHVIKSDILRDNNLMFPGTVDFYLKISHSVAEIQHIVLAQLDPIPETARVVCRWCGNVLGLDKRGGCKACGAPPGKSRYA